MQWWWRMSSMGWPIRPMGALHASNDSSVYVSNRGDVYVQCRWRMCPIEGAYVCPMGKAYDSKGAKVSYASNGLFSVIKEGRELHEILKAFSYHHSPGFYY